MGLSGSLQSFGVPEILQLLALQRKSGVLSLVNGIGERQVLFIERGKIVGTRDRRDHDEDPILDFLRRAGYLGEEQIGTVAQVQKQTGRDAVYIMLSAGLIGRDRLIEAVGQHTQQIIDRLLGWSDGTYEFSGDERSIPRTGLKIPLSIEELLMEGMRRMDELATIKQAVLAPDLFLVRATAPADRGSLTRELLIVYDMVQDSNSVESLVARSPLGEYGTYEAISALLESGVLVVDPCPPPPVIDQTPTPLEVVVPTARQPVYSTWAGVGALTLASLLLGLALGPTLRSPGRDLYPPAVAEARYRADQALAREVYRRHHGRNASTVELIEAGYLQQDPATPISRPLFGR